MSHGFVIRGVMTAVAVMAFASSACAQGGTDPIAPTPAAALTPSNSSLLRGQVAELFSVYVPRPAADIQTQLDNAREFQVAANAQITQARALAVEADNRAKIMKDELETTRTKRGVAKKNKDKAAADALEATAKRQADELAYFENLRDAMEAEADRIMTEQEAMAARVKSLQLETLVAKKNEELRSPLAPSDGAGQYEIMLRNLLEAQGESADKFRQAAEKDKRVVERRMAQLKSLAKLQK